MDHARPGGVPGFSSVGGGRPISSQREIGSNLESLAIGVLRIALPMASASSAWVRSPQFILGGSALVANDTAALWVQTPARDRGPSGVTTFIESEVSAWSGGS